MRADLTSQLEIWKFSKFNITLSKKLIDMETEKNSINKVSPWYDHEVSHEYATLNGRRYR